MKLNWGNYIFIFILLFLALCTIFIIFAVSQNNDLVHDNYYELGAGYSDQMRITERSAAYSDSMDFKIKDDHILLRLPPSVHQYTDSVRTYFYRPSGKKDDYSGEFRISGDSVIVEKDILARGRYILNIIWTIEGERYLVKKDIFID